MILPDHLLKELLGLRPRENELISTAKTAPFMSSKERAAAEKRFSHIFLRMDPPPAEEAVQPASVDLRLDLSKGVYRLEEWNEVRYVPGWRTPIHVPETEILFGPDVRNLPDYRHDPCSDGRLVLEPGDCVLASTLELVGLGRMLSAQVSGKSSIGRVFVPIHITAGFIDPGFMGQITLEIHNASKRRIVFLDQTYVCQLVVSMLLEPAEFEYGNARRRSRYWGQTGPTVPKK